MAALQLEVGQEGLDQIQAVMYAVALEAIEEAKKSAAVDVRYMTKKQTCDYMGIAYLTLEKWIEQGLKVIKINQKVYIDRRDLDQFLLNHKR